MCKAMQYVYTCGHKHVKRSPCNFTVKHIGKKGVQTTSCKGAYLKLIDGEVGGANKARLEGAYMTISFEKKCASCTKEGMLTRKKEKVAAVKERYGKFPEWSLYAQTKIDKEEAEYEWLKERLDRDVTLTPPKGTFDNEARLPFKIKKRSAKQKKPRQKYSSFLRRRQEKEKLEGELLMLLIEQVEDDTDEEDDDEEDDEEQPEAEPALDLQEDVEGHGTEQAAADASEPRRSGRVRKLPLKLR
ncbi:hypothetical protein PRZ48_010102 [Zasmidium cellare]|uniref:Uncharacterized protein n=1 Tax=Zasmidium cellare TaxID=395010 RepID=A0ABR0EDL1_ZASCE|nr:hypothetical protein PRZ48_010102 [Zasmidium cellare]